LTEPERGRSDATVFQWHNSEFSIFNSQSVLLTVTPGYLIALLRGRSELTRAISFWFFADRHHIAMRLQV